MVFPLTGKAIFVFNFHQSLPFFFSFGWLSSPWNFQLPFHLQLSLFTLHLSFILIIFTSTQWILIIKHPLPALRTFYLWDWSFPHCLWSIWTVSSMQCLKLLPNLLMLFNLQSQTFLPFWAFTANFRLEYIYTWIPPCPKQKLLFPHLFFISHIWFPTRLWK